jgi:hypothetical protein
MPFTWSPPATLIVPSGFTVPEWQVVQLVEVEA